MPNIILLLLALTKVSRSQMIVHTNGVAGEACGESRCRSTPRQSVCINNVCMCQCPFPSGHGLLQCVTRDDEFCAVYSDPTLMDFAKFHVHVLASYKFVLARVRTRPCRMAATGVILAAGQCQVTVLAWGGYWRGKTFLKGVEVRYNISMGAMSPWFRNFRLYGDAAGGVYNFTLDGNETNDPDSSGTTYGDPEHLVLGRTGSTMFEIDEKNNMVSVEGVCGVRVSIRPVDRSSPQQLMSGVSVAVNKQCVPEYLSSDASICSSPSEEVSKFRALADSLSNVTRLKVTPRVAAMFFILRSNVTQNFPGAAPVLHDLFLTSGQCEDRYLAEAVTRCLYLQEFPKFVKCMAPTDHAGSQIISLFAACIRSFCSRSAQICTAVKFSILSKQCHRHLPSWKRTILSFDCAMLNM